jgi:hypothetical protein
VAKLRELLPPARHQTMVAERAAEPESPLAAVWPRAPFGLWWAGPAGRRGGPRRRTGTAVVGARTTTTARTALITEIHGNDVAGGGAGLGRSGRWTPFCCRNVRMPGALVMKLFPLVPKPWEMTPTTSPSTFIAGPPPIPA